MIDKEMERIVSLTIKFEKQFKLDRDEVLRYILEKMGYKKCNYIPEIYDTEDLDLIQNLIYQYNKKRALSVETFIYNFCNYYNYCITYGFQADLNHTLCLKE